MAENLVFNALDKQAFAALDDFTFSSDGDGGEIAWPKAK
jgi:hypothetical protein